MQHIFLKGMLTVLLLLLVTSLVLGAASVPNLINFQGRLTDASGNPVADGSHTVNFTLWTLPVGGSTVWTENTSQTTSSGLFTHNLGSITVLPATLFQTYDSLYLQVQADGQTILPRIRLTSTPYTRVSNILETDNTIIPGNLAFESVPTGLFRTFGDDGLEQIRLWGNSWGEIYLYDSDVTNDITVVLTANSSEGGELNLRNDAGTTTIDLHGGLTGDASAVLPLGAINAAEMLNEPGVSNSVGPSFFGLSSGNITYVVDSVDITIPSSGYVEVLCGAYLNLYHVTGVSTSIYIGSNKTRGSAPVETGVAVARVPGIIATSSIWAFPMTSSKLYAEAAGTHRYYLHVDYETGTSASSALSYSYIRAKYYPTLYGTATLANATAGADLINTSTDGSLPAPPTEITTITVQDHNARLEAEVAKVKAELEARLQKLEQRLNKQDSGVEK
ncbi:MAG TPA: hypothetical protein VJ165_05605 [candidate division Zixibacteria bacterium]|nr:hypothetical protein [candidate division Zixibacteria bacterium]